MFLLEEGKCLGESFSVVHLFFLRMVFVTTTCTMLYIEPVGWVQSQYNEMPSPWGKVLHKLGNSNTKEVLPLL